MNNSLSEEEKRYWIAVDNEYIKIRQEEKIAKKRKPVCDVDVFSMWNFIYQAKSLNGQIIASDSLINLKEEIKNRRWIHAYITCSNGSLSYGQSIVNEYCYRPRYK
ncbi:hypothetical protein EHV15_35330 [Paenibacillus oralis]|uniref:Uncharacterized protein n=1 Tax=Paenibacillus oralis TaxID=2490856 RepID=A0A3P3TCL6_9BACL|nr:hypothetical protein [Paenibacillus oralis]RRJ54848.1 hypothetical protein EHV15_35330 [Paenibacillus oralis]